MFRKKTCFLIRCRCLKGTKNYPKRISNSRISKTIGDGFNMFQSFFKLFYLANLKFWFFSIFLLSKWVGLNKTNTSLRDIVLCRQQKLTHLFSVENRGTWCRWRGRFFQFAEFLFPRWQRGEYAAGMAMRRLTEIFDYAGRKPHEISMRCDVQNLFEFCIPTWRDDAIWLAHIFVWFDAIPSRFKTQFSSNKTWGWWWQWKMDETWWESMPVFRYWRWVLSVARFVC